jgi:hypothetical protein
LNGGDTATDTDCNMVCTGNALEICGAGARLSLYWSGQTPPPLPSTAATIGNWTSIGCYTYVFPYETSKPLLHVHIPFFVAITSMAPDGLSLWAWRLLTPLRWRAVLLRASALAIRWLEVNMQGLYLFVSCLMMSFLITLHIYRECCMFFFLPLAAQLA